MPKKVASASGKPPNKRTRRPMDKKIVKSYLDELSDALGDDAKFMIVFERLVKDRQIRQTEALEIGCKFTTTMAASTSKKAIFDRILRRHKNLKSFKGQQRAVAGRSAA